MDINTITAGQIGTGAQGFARDGLPPAELRAVQMAAEQVKPSAVQGEASELSFDAIDTKGTKWPDGEESGDGKITRDEYRAAMEKKHGKGATADLAVDEFFRDADEDGDGVVTKEEYASYQARKKLDDQPPKKAPDGRFPIFKW